jgi:hypothetical protein
MCGPQICTSDIPAKTDIVTHLAWTDGLRADPQSRLLRHGMAQQKEPIQRQIRSAIKAQVKIGWDQFFRGWMHCTNASQRRYRKNQLVVHTTKADSQPGESFTPEQWWMRTTIKKLWAFSITIWKQRKLELHGTG